MTTEDRNNDIAMVRARFTTAMGWLVLAGAGAIYRVESPPLNDFQAFADLRYHPVATLYGALAVVLGLTPIAYWLGGLVFGRLRGSR